MKLDDYIQHYLKQQLQPDSDISHARLARERIQVAVGVLLCALLTVVLVFVVVLITMLLNLSETTRGAIVFMLGAFVSTAFIGIAQHKARLKATSNELRSALDELQTLTREVTATNQQLSVQTGTQPANSLATDASLASISSQAPDFSQGASNSYTNLGIGTPTTSTITIDELTKRIVGVNNPLDKLKTIANDILSREDAWLGRGCWAEGREYLRRRRLALQATNSDMPPLPAGPDPNPEETPIPSGVELFLAHRLQEAGLFDEDVEFPRMHIVRPQSSGMFYLRIEQPQVAYNTMLAIVRIESALNAVRFACSYNDDSTNLTERDCICFNQRLTSSVVAQAESVDMSPEDAEHGDAEGEWAVRHALSVAIESFQLPYRLSVSFRANVADGNVAFEVALTPGDVFPLSYYPADYPTPTPLQSTKTSRRQLASAYALRVAILLAACAFRTTPKIKHVWVAGILETPTRHDCYYSIDFDRWRFNTLDLENIDDLEDVLHRFCPVMRFEDGFLRPIQQTFSLSEERFCPRKRYESVTLSTRRLAEPHSRALGTDHVSGLAIDESDKRELVANDILRHLVDPSHEHATEHNVRTILEIAGDDPDPSVRSAAERTVSALAEGTLSGDPFTVAEAFIAGDELTQACQKSAEALNNRNAEEAFSLISAVLSPIEAAGTYTDSSTVEWRYFESFVERTLYNRLSDHPERSLMLIPESYVTALFLAASTLMLLERPESALHYTRELLRIAPLDTRAHLQMVRVLENCDKHAEAIEQLKELLRIAHDPQSVGTAYYRMAYFQWLQGQTLVARACYTAALRYLPAAVGQITAEIATLSLQTGTIDALSDFDLELSPNEIIKIFTSHDIPVAPSDTISSAFLECAQASVDAEVFPVARNFLSTIAAFAPDDVIVGLMRSLEDAPDSL